MRLRKQQGFALVMTILLLGLLVVVVVSLATVTRVETGIAGNTRRFSQARQNALMALNIAIGELQAAAGPDQRVTATADIVDAAVENPYWTGVWESTGDFRQWLVSGEFTALGDADDVVDPDPEVSVLLVGPNSAGADGARHVRAWVEDIRAPYPDPSGDLRVGRYAWWVGDEGVKASMALPDRLSGVDYGPYEIAENRRRLRQQVPLTHQSFRGGAGTPSGKHGFDPAVADNYSLLQNVVAREQLSFLTPASGVGLLGTVRERFHDWTAQSLGVMANTLPAGNPDRGLMQDLSADPTLLGPDIESWLDYNSYVEGTHPGSVTFNYPPIDSEEDTRRVYQITPPSNAGDVAGTPVHVVAPVITDFIIQLGFHRPNASSPIELRARLHVALWNPYSSALALEPLSIEVTGLPTVTVAIDGQAGSTEVALQDHFPNLAQIALPFDNGRDEVGVDRVVWLPGRMMQWRTGIGLVGDDTGAQYLDDEPLLDALRFGAKSLRFTLGWLSATPVASPSAGSGKIQVSGSTNSVTVTLKDDSGNALGSYAINEAINWDTGPITESGDPASDNRWCVGFGFRRAQPSTGIGWGDNSWLETLGEDPRQVIQVGFTGPLRWHNPNEESDPTGYGNEPETDWSGATSAFVFNRAPAGTSGSQSFNNDLPLFELPRMPLLSLGALQHVHIAGYGPFSIGNSWGADIPDPTDSSLTVAGWFDRYFFSGLTDPGGWDPSMPTPNSHFRFFDPDGSFVATDSYWSEYLLNAAAYNVNSTSVPAWEAVLKSLRPGAPDVWEVADLQTGTGTVSTAGASFEPDVQDNTQAPSGTSAQPSAFFRFSQSIQETFATTGSESSFNRSNFRQALRGGSEGTGDQATRNLTTVDITSIANAIVTRIRENGPILSMAEFVSPMFGSASLLEQAIQDAGVNSEARFGIDFDGDGNSNEANVQMPMSGHKLTQADILTAIGPMLQARSDTFLIRAYGESLNPITGDVEGRAWCEATLQRIPTPFDPDDDIVAPDSDGLGRRFQIVSFRWLTPADI